MSAPGLGVFSTSHTVPVGGYSTVGGAGASAPTFRPTGTSAAREMYRSICGGFAPAIAIPVGALITAGILAKKAADGTRSALDAKARQTAASGDKKGEVKHPDNPKEKPGSFKPAGSKGARENTEDGSVWEKDTSGHGGEQWKRWPNKKSWEKGEQPNSIWPDGRVRK